MSVRCKLFGHKLQIMQDIWPNEMSWYVACKRCGQRASRHVKGWRMDPNMELTPEFTNMHVKDRLLALGFVSNDLDTNIREALKELYHHRRGY